MAVAADTDMLTPPCGACRQILWEFCGDVEIVLVNLHGKTETYQSERSLPEALRCFVSCSFFLFVLALAAEPADWIWSARYVITMDPQRRVIENGAVAIRGDRILGGRARRRRSTRASRRSSGSTVPTRSSRPA